MIERIKTVALVGLILLSLYLTHMLWFGSPYLEEGMLPRFESALFTPLPKPEVLLLPASALLEQEGTDLYYFRRGNRELELIWKTTYRYLHDILPGVVEERVGDNELDDLLQKASFKLIFNFNPPLPESFLWERRAFQEELHAIQLVDAEGDIYAVMEGKERLLYHLNAQEEISLTGIYAAFTLYKTWQAEQLPSSFVLRVFDLPDGGRGVNVLLPEKETAMEDEETKRVEPDGTPGENVDEGESYSPLDPAPVPDPVDKEETAPAADAEKPEAAAPEVQNNGEIDGQPAANEMAEEFVITVQSNIYIPEIFQAREIYLLPEELPRKELVNAFFLDSAMARRIEERDGATYFTDGIKGLRLYAAGGVEYTAPVLDVSSNRLSYASALLQAAENQCLYGGWPTSAYLEKAEKKAGGYLFSWRSYLRGLPLVMDKSGSEMLVNDKGMPYYRRNFYLFSGDMGESQPFSPYADALYTVIKMHRELVTDQEFTLLSLEQVLRVRTDFTGLIAIPVWAVHFAETGPVYLNWHTLERI